MTANERVAEPPQQSRADTYGESDLVMHAHKLDCRDLRILSQLQKEGRISNVKLAQKVSISPPPCLRRKATLERKGYIKGYYAALDAKKLGFEVEAFVSVRLSGQTTASIQSFEQRIRIWCEVRECYALSGNVDFLLKCVATNLESLQHFVTSELMREATVTGVRTSIIVRTTKREPGVPVEAARVLVRHAGAGNG